MIRQSKQSGFAVLELVLLLVIAGIIGGTGYFVYHSQQATDTSLTNTAKSHSNVTIVKKSPVATNNPNSSKTDVTPSLKTFTSSTNSQGSLGYTYQYPSTWTHIGTDAGGEVADSVTNNAGDKINTSLINTGHPGADYEPTVRYAQPIHLIVERAL